MTFHLHETFRPNKVTIAQQPFVIARIGWGYFEIHIVIKFKAWTKLPDMEVDHMLSFDEGGASAGFFIEVEKEWVEKNADKGLVASMGAL